MPTPTHDDPTAVLLQDLAALPAEQRAELERAGFDPSRFVALAKTLRHGDAATRRDTRNRVAGEVSAPADHELLRLPPEGSAEEARLASLGEKALVAGELAFCVMAGGMATRMGGVVKALVEALPGKTFLDLRLAENRAACQRAGRAVPLWLMVSDATDEPTRDALAKAEAPAHVATFRQDASLRLTPEGGLFRHENGDPSAYSTGHGDTIDALRRSGLLRSFVDTGGKYVWIANLDNLGATIDLALLGLFLESQRDVMVEVAEKEPGDKGGIPVHAPAPGGGRRLQVLEEFRLPRGFDAEKVRVFNTNTFLIRADRLLDVEVAWNWFEVEKKVDGKSAVQFERLLQEITSALDAAYVCVPRHGAAARFLPAKDFDELAKRKEHILAVARARGML
ncbi:MAG TPA: UTP--glucose-1-phosphate uridylyltransferase [Polyangiaceae bacterium]